MFTYHQINAIHEHRFGRFIKERNRARVTDKRGHIGLRQLLGALAGQLAGLGFRGGDRRGYPAGPAY